ncbi:hypothetical protein [Mesorhizobium sp. 8]|uniref:hypothetical protein n=1 Tax=Mesorhizobium sp. 8 TaxID=2584466 RepID=UPI00112260A3|nr:hypothetical protein [Mesorhizobium sp. 8]QDC00352.1 hypothetical protein FGU64_07950 [Mesorhizobium sp. 8]
MITTTKPLWPASELRITKNQAAFLANGLPPSWSPGLSDRTEDSLSRRRMLSWVVTPSGHGALRANAKGLAALNKYHGRSLVAANDNKGTMTNAA